MKTTDANFIGKPLPEFSNVQVMSYLITTHHEFTRNIMEEISDLIGEAAKELSQPPTELTELAQIWKEYHEDMLKHLADEENILFPWIDQVTQSGKNADDVSSEYSASIRRMVEEHGHHEDHMHQVKILADALSAMGGYVPVLARLAYKLRQLDVDLHEHMEIETKLLFPRIMGVPV